jgi:hypothetical protein
MCHTSGQLWYFYDENLSLITLEEEDIFHQASNQDWLTWAASLTLKHEVQKDQPR